MALKIPDYLEPFIGWRSWSIDGEGLLRSANQALWMPKEPHKAQCISGYYRITWPEARDTSHRNGLSIRGCSCGIYAYKTLKTHCEYIARAQSMPYGSVSLGQVYLWGRIIEHTDGYRAEYAYPKAIIVNEGVDTERLAKDYNIEVEAVPSIEIYLLELVERLTGIKRGRLRGNNPF